MSDYIKTREYIAEQKARIKTAAVISVVVFVATVLLVFAIPAFVRWLSRVYESHILYALIQFAHTLRAGAVNAEIAFNNVGVSIAFSAGALFAVIAFVLYFVILRYAAKDKQRQSQPGPRR